MRHRAASHASWVDRALTVAAMAGVTCVALAVAGYAAGLRIILFSTGSMEPTIPIGAAAVTMPIPASEARVGDVVTVDRPGQRPITHRIVEVDQQADGVSLVLKGDANDSADPYPYVVDTVHRVYFAVPGVAPAVAALGRPPTLIALTALASALVLWTMWPRDAASRPRPAPRGAVAAAIALVAGSAVLVPAAPASAAPTATVVISEHMTVTSVLDPVAAAALAPGMPVVWDVAVDVETGSLADIQFTAVASGGAPEGLVVRSAPCPGALGDSCPASLGPITLTPGSPASDLGGLAQVASGWVRLWIELPPGATQGSGQTALTVWVTAVGESIPVAPPSPGLAGTGPRWLGLASLASVLSLAGVMALWGAARRGERGDVAPRGAGEAA